MLEEFKRHINDQLPFLRDCRLLVAVSGGLDSVALCHLCCSVGLEITLAHCNFRLRGSESDCDEQFVLQLAEEKGLEVFIQHFETERFAKEHKLSTQMAARELRYEWFKELADQLDFDFILTAHHADDELETFLINLSRGTGLDGLTGIQELNENVVRPLLGFTREDILNYAHSENLIWQEDSSNASVKYLRNMIRLEVIPKLKEIGPQFLENFKRTQQHLGDASILINDRIDETLRGISDVRDDGIHFNLKKLNQLDRPEAYLYHLFKDYEFTDWLAINDLLNAQSGKQICSENYCLLKDRDALILTQKSKTSSTEVFIHESQSTVETEIGLLTFTKVKALSEKQIKIHDPKCIYVDNDRLKFPLIIKKYEPGDVFHPIGMNGKKKVSKYFKDEKLSMIEKDQVRLLYAQDEVIWIIGMRADDRFKVTHKTKQILKIELL